MKLSFVITAFNKFNYTKNAIQQLSLLKDHEIVLVDNNSSDETSNTPKLFPHVKYIRNSENLGFGKANNIGYENTTSDIVCFINNDIKVKSSFEDWTDLIIPHCKDGLVGPTMGLINSDFSFVKETNEQLSDRLSYLSGWCIASTKDNWNKIALLDEGKIWNEKFFAYFEDTHLSFVAKKNNIKLIQKNIPVQHYGKITSSQLNTSTLYKNSLSIFKELNKKWNY